MSLPPSKKRSLSIEAEDGRQPIALPFRPLDTDTDSKGATQHASFDGAMDSQPLEQVDNMFDLQLMTWHNTANPGHSMATLEDIHYFRKNLRYPWRGLSDAFNVSAELGIIKPGLFRLPHMRGNVALDGNDLFKRKRILGKIDEDAWRSALGDFYPKQWDTSRLIVYVQFPDKRPDPSSCVFFPASGHLYAQWLEAEVHHGRRNVYCLQVIYDERECYRKPKDDNEGESEGNEED